MFTFIESKLRPPDLKPGMVRRQHIVERLRSDFGLSATLICAGPGWGKTTAAAESVVASDRECIWYDLDPSDADLVVFFQYLTRAVQKIAPGFGRHTLALVSAGAARAEQAADIFLYELSEQVEEDLTIVLDNAHHIFAADWSAPLLTRLLQLLPETVHMIMLARVAPEFTFSRLRSKQSLDLIDDGALAFTRDEAAALMRGVLDDAGALDLLLARTRGWVAGLQIIRQALESDPGLCQEDVEEIIAKSQIDIFHYFADKVYRAEHPAVREILLRSALPRRFTPEILNQALEVTASPQQLDRIMRENTFLSRIAGETDSYIFHPLFREFLCNQFEEESPAEEILRLHGNLAVYYGSRGEWEPALHHYFEAGDEGGAARMLASSDRQLLAGGLTRTVSQYFSRFSPATLDRHPPLYNLMGDLRIMEGDEGSAWKMYSAGVRASHESGDQAAEAAALAGLAHAAARDYKFADALRYTAEAEERLSAGRLDMGHPEDGAAVPPRRLQIDARIKNIRGAVRAFEGRFPEATDLMEEALVLARRSGDERLARAIAQNLALPAYLEGDFRKALGHLSRSLISNGRLHPDTVTLYLNRAAVYTARGELDAADRDLASAAQVAEVFSLGGFMPRILEGKANLARERRQFDEASMLYHSALNEYRRADADPVKTDLYYERALFELRRSERGEALDLINLMIADRNERQRPVEEALARQMRARIRVKDEPARALPDLTAAEPLLRRGQYNYYLAINCYIKARTLAGHDAQAAEQALREFLALAERFDYSYFVACEESFDPALGELCRSCSVKSQWADRIMCVRL